MERRTLRNLAINSIIKNKINIKELPKCLITEIEENCFTCYNSLLIFYRNRNAIKTDNCEICKKECRFCDFHIRCNDCDLQYCYYCCAKLDNDEKHRCGDVCYKCYLIVQTKR